MTLYYPDVSSHNAGIDLSGALVVGIKATEGTGYVNPEIGRQRAEAAAHGAWAFLYHFLRGDSDPAAQAAHAYRQAGHAPLMLDFEPDEPTDSYPTLAQALAFIDVYRAAGGVCHLNYLPRWYWSRPVRNPVTGQPYGLGSPSLQPFIDRGVALVSSAYVAYTDADTGPGWQPYGGQAPSVWQYTSTMRFGGQANVDFNAFRGSYAGRQDPASVAATIAEFKSLLTTGYLTPPPPPPAPSPGVAMSAITQNPHLDVVPATAKTLIVASDPGLLGKAEVDVRVAVHSAGGWHVDNLKLTQAAPVARVAAAGGDAVSLIVATAGAQAGYGFA